MGHVAKRAAMPFDFDTCWQGSAEQLIKWQFDKWSIIYCSIWVDGTNSSGRARVPSRSPTATGAGARCTRGSPSTGSASTRTNCSSTWSSAWESKRAENFKGRRARMSNEWFDLSPLGTGDLKPSGSTCRVRLAIATGRNRVIIFCW